jgi:hypothetical protein
LKLLFVLCFNFFVFLKIKFKNFHFSFFICLVYWLYLKKSLIDLSIKKVKLYLELKQSFFVFKFLLFCLSPLIAIALINTTSVYLFTCLAGWLALFYLRQIKRKCTSSNQVCNKVEWLFDIQLLVVLFLLTRVNFCYQIHEIFTLDCMHTPLQVSKMRFWNCLSNLRRRHTHTHTDC